MEEKRKSKNLIMIQKIRIEEILNGGKRRKGWITEDKEILWEEEWREVEDRKERKRGEMEANK